MRIPSFIDFVSKPSPQILTILSQGNLQLLKTIQQIDELDVFFDNLMHEWHPQTLIHGDLKADNILVIEKRHQDERHKNETQIKIIDWEFADIGDPAWDIGSIFHEFVINWLSSLKVYNDKSIKEYAKSSYTPDHIKTMLNSFWKSYENCSSLGNNESRELLIMSTKLCAVRLIQAAFESLYTSNTISEKSIFLLQVSLNIIKHVDDAISYLFGIVRKV